jgi:RNA 2',3'-cyclic 3'-phosphodiesterase
MGPFFADVVPLAGADAPLHTLFFGLLPPPETARSARSFSEDLVRSGKAKGALRPARVLHLSLLVIDKEVAEPPPARAITALCERAGSVSQRPFSVSLNRVEAWGRPGRSGPVVALGDDGVIGVETLHRNLAAALGLPSWPDFNPHMTLLYGAGPSAPLRFPPMSWSVRDFALIHSFVGESRYEVVRRFPLWA